MEDNWNNIISYISIMAHELVTVQVSTITSDSVFNTRVQLIEDHRTRLDITAI